MVRKNGIEFHNFNIKAHPIRALGPQSFSKIDTPVSS